MILSTQPLIREFRAIRSRTEELARPLSPEDQTVQSMPDASPTKWHRAHTSWFFETFVLSQFSKNYAPFDPTYQGLFNSYYDGIGPQFSRAHRGSLSRPGADAITRYRAHVDDEMERLLASASEHPEAAQIHETVTLGLHHEQQHQELILTDIKHALWLNPAWPAYQAISGQLGSGEAPTSRTSSDVGSRYLKFSGGLIRVGMDSEWEEGARFSFDNERPRHQLFLDDFALGAQLVSSGDVLDFIRAGGYQNPLLWLSDGYQWVKDNGILHPLYLRQEADGSYAEHTLNGVRTVEREHVASHLSYFEAEAIARFLGARLPSEAEWEHASEVARSTPNQMGPLHPGEHLHPHGVVSGQDAGAPSGMFNHVWQWTQSPYVAYPGFTPAAGAVGEYNGKFMHNQMVLRGSSCLTPTGHGRRTYRNFFPSTARWQMSGLRLAKRETP